MVPLTKMEIFKMRFCRGLIPEGRGNRDLAQGGGPEPRGEVMRGLEGGSNGSCRRVVELVQSMQGGHTGYLHLKVMRGRWLLALTSGGRRILEAEAGLSLPRALPR